MQLTHILRKLFAAENVEMQMLDALTTILSNVSDNTVSVFKTASHRNLGNSLKHRADRRRIICIYAICRLNVLARNNKHVNGRLGIYILKCVDLFVLVNLGRWNLTRNYPAK